MFELLSIINSPDIQRSLLWVKIPMGISVVLFTGIIIYTLIRTKFLWDMYFADFAEFFTFRPFGIRRMTRAWNDVKARLETQNEDEYKLAVTEADGILSNIIIKMRLQGETTEEKLNAFTPAMVANLEDVKQAHATRNSIVHNPDYRLSLDEAKQLLAVYEKAFQSLDLI